MCSQRPCRQTVGRVFCSCFTVTVTRRITTIARRRYFRPQDNYNRGPNINDRIRAKQVRLIDENNEMVGVVDLPEALNKAYEAGLDLVEVAADSDPPVCRILDFGKYKYEQSKKDKANKARSKTSELKEVRLGRSLKIDPHDIQIRINQAKKFLLEGHKVQIVQNFRGREMMHRERGNKRMQEIIDTLSEIGKVETPPRMAGRRMTMIVAPDKAKIEQISRKKQKEQQQAEQKEGGESDDRSATPTDQDKSKKGTKGESDSSRSNGRAPSKPEASDAPEFEHADADRK